jgi:hypothetical protein
MLNMMHLRRQGIYDVIGRKEINSMYKICTTGQVTGTWCCITKSIAHRVIIFLQTLDHVEASDEDHGRRDDDLLPGQWLALPSRGLFACARCMKRG